MLNAFHDVMVQQMLDVVPKHRDVVLSDVVEDVVYVVEHNDAPRRCAMIQSAIYDTELRSDPLPGRTALTD
jgi:hypothetical protein